MGAGLQTQKRPGFKEAGALERTKRALMRLADLAATDFPAS